MDLAASRRAPKVTVTREGESLCQKWCYLISVNILCPQHPILAVNPPCPAAVERVETDTPEAAREILEARGWTDLRQHTTELHEYIMQQGDAASNPEYRFNLKPKEELVFVRGG